MTSLTISDRASLAAARRTAGADEAVILTARLKHRNLLPCAVKYAFWSVRPGGRIVIRDAGGKNAAPATHSVSFNLVRQWTFKFIGAGCRLVSMDDHELVLERIAPLPSLGWSAGVVFSGSDGEVPTLMKCLEGLVRQPELSAAEGGEIVVCGPPRDLGFLAGFPQVRYLEYETPPGPRFLIGRKKNALMAALSNPRMAILHARVVLDDGALGHAPAEFDISGPAVRVATGGGEQPYLSLFQTDGVWPGSDTPRSTLGMRDVPSGDPLELMERGGVFVDGGAFYVMRAVFEACPLHPEVAWEEGEDVEWCGRAFADGFLVDLAPASGARSQTNKLKDWSRFGALEGPLRRTLTALKAAQAGMKARIERASGRR